MNFDLPLVSGVLIQRYKRFLADVKLDSGEYVTALCPNTGSMKTCKTPGWRVALSPADNPERKTRFTWEMIHNGICWIGINTHRANAIVAEGIISGAIPELGGYASLRREVKYGKNSRIDLLLEDGERLCYVEVKNVSLVENDGHYQFPDAVTERGRKHLYELGEMVSQGHRAVMLFLIQRSDGHIFKPAKSIDPDYAAALVEAFKNGVEILPYRAEVSPEKIEIVERIGYEL